MIVTIQSLLLICMLGNSSALVCLFFQPLSFSPTLPGKGSSAVAFQDPRSGDQLRPLQCITARGSTAAVMVSVSSLAVSASGFLLHWEHFRTPGTCFTLSRRTETKIFPRIICHVHCLTTFVWGARGSLFYSINLGSL